MRVSGEEQEFADGEDLDDELGDLDLDEDADDVVGGRKRQSDPEEGGQLKFK